MYVHINHLLPHLHFFSAKQKLYYWPFVRPIFSVLSVCRMRDDHAYANTAVHLSALAQRNLDAKTGNGQLSHCKSIYRLTQTNMDTHADGINVSLSTPSNLLNTIQGYAANDSIELTIYFPFESDQRWERRRAHCPFCTLGVVQTVKCAHSDDIEPKNEEKNLRQWQLCESGHRASSEANTCNRRAKHDAIIRNYWLHGDK